VRPDQIDTLWSPTAEGRRWRQRVAAGAALAILVSGLLASAGLFTVVIGLLIVVCAVVAALAVTAALHMSWPQLSSSSRRLRERGAELTPHAKAFGRGVRTGTARVAGASALAARAGARHVRRLGASGVARVRVGAPAVAARTTAAGSQAGRWISDTARAGGAKAGALTEQVKREAASRRAEDPGAQTQEALQLNAEGIRLRREGLYEESSDLHQHALGILRAVGDRRAIALTLNNLALAVSHTDGDRTAIVLFEEAASILHELGEEEQEGRVIANLGLTHRRQGRREQSENVLQLALTKLTPTSPAYQTVEAELRRAS
jgi:hypothetical protein